MIFLTINRNLKKKIFWAGGGGGGWGMLEDRGV